MLLCGLLICSEIKLSTARAEINENNPIRVTKMDAKASCSFGAGNSSSGALLIDIMLNIPKIINTVPTIYKIIILS